LIVVSAKRSPGESPGALPARIGNADFDLLEGRVVLEGITLGPRPDGVATNDAAPEPPVLDPPAALVHAERVATQLSWRDPRDRTLHPTERVIDSTGVQGEREADGRVDPLRHAQPGAQPSTEPEPAPESGEPSLPWKIVLDRFVVHTPATSAWFRRRTRENASGSGCRSHVCCSRRFRTSRAGCGGRSRAATSSSPRTRPATPDPRRWTCRAGSASTRSPSPIRSAPRSPSAGSSSRSC
jgi:hypothetical protein